ncbi:hypothetical protein [Faecalibacterium prausnitzii]|uniref:Uncharacterized protein n=1 Tax=Faecalibacterium prausnitzii TaxID=853 RepID=A0A6L5TKM8_9FIRM|nr:hypothetical protein [Faecalibacterium prausnitzii]MSC47163.1 hypothetical protein [Faecalibacterium prausnitzii]MSC70312.1 hypothetical protein [Faecalibacterium prausnitzii]MSC76337.1 hypothetical protein [Faecalibacterium prausnitzii]MSC82117.1 hypothetical protein [Faecalibacterium prausnitzii]MSC92352.1 hypothetical protein [Faecalibacterium prausnitzii]
MAPFCIAAANGCFYGALDVPQHLPAHVADCCAEGKDGIRGGEVVDRLKIVLIEPPGRLKAAAFQQRVGDADCSSAFELHLHPGFIIIHQERPVNDGTDVLAVVVPVISDQLSGNIRKLLTDPFMADAVCSSQCIRNRSFQIIVVLPHLRVTGIAAHPGVRHIENVVQPGESAGFVQQSDALGTPAHIAVHPVVPDVKVGAGGGIRALCEDHKLVGKGVLVQPGCGGQVVRPAFPVSGQAVGRALGKGKVFFGFAWHSVPPFFGFQGIKRAGNRFGVAR